MIAWAVIVLTLSLLGFVLNVMAGIDVNLLLHDVAMGLVALGLLIRIKFKSKAGRREQLLWEVSRLKEQKNFLQCEKALLEAKITHLKQRLPQR